MARKVSEQLSRRRHLFGLFLLFIVNVCWVAAAEISRFIFVDLNFQRPFLITYVKLCTLTVYMLRYVMERRCSSSTAEPKGYDKLINVSDKEPGDAVVLTPAEFEQVTLSEESDVERASNAARRVRFAQVREVRHMPTALADEALKARLPYAATRLLCVCAASAQLKYAIVLSIMWIICTLSYQGSLLFLSVSSVNLVSASSSLLVLLFSALCAFTPNDRITLTKLLLVVCNLLGVALISEYSVSVYGTSLALFSAISYALYLVYFSYCQSAGLNIDMNFMFGMVGVLTMTVYTPLLFYLHYMALEPLFPLATREQWLMMLLSGVVGSVFSDYLWLQATKLTSSLAASISLSMSIPLSLLADTVFRGSPPSSVQLMAAVPITISFLGAALLRVQPDGGLEVHEVASGSDEGLRLIQEDSPDDEQL